MFRKHFLIVLIGVFATIIPFGVRGVGASAFTEPPKIVSRSEWLNESLLKLVSWQPSSEEEPSDYQPVERIIIHHTATSNDKLAQYSAREILESIFRYHAVTRGWGDIGYNYLIDPEGSIYEGRTGGNGVRGAHVYDEDLYKNFNFGSIGIAVLGDFTQKEVSEKAYESLVKLVGWLAANNDLAISDLNKATKIWDSQKKDFSASFRGPAVGGHQDFEATKCPGDYLYNKLPELRKRAEELKIFYQKYLYETPEERNLYFIKAGESWRLNASKDKVVLGKEWEAIMPLRTSQLAAYPFHSATLYPNGTLVRERNVSRVFLIKEGLRKPIASAALFDKLVYQWDKIIELSPIELSTYLLGDFVLYPDGSLVRAEKDEKVYLVSEGGKRHITSAALFNKLGYRWNAINLISPEELGSYLGGETVKFPDGSLVKGTSPNVYFIEDGVKERIPSIELFNKKGFRWQDVFLLEDKELAAYPDGGIVLYPDDSLVKEENFPQVYLVKNGKKHWIKTLEAFWGLGYKWKDIIELTGEEMANYGLGSMIEAAKDLLNLKDEEIALPEKEIPKEESEKKERVEAEPSKEEKMTKEPLIRVGLKELKQGEVVKITANLPYQVYKNGQVLEEKKAEEIFETKAGENFYRFGASDKEVIFEVISYEDRPSWKPSLNDNLFRGAIEVRASSVRASSDATGGNEIQRKIWLINELPLESYLKGIAEALNQDPLEYRLAFSLAIRTYALHYIEIEAKYPEEPFHLTNTARDQLYKGYGFEIRAANLVAAIEKARGEIIEYQGDAIIAAYSSDSCGVSRDARQVWGSRFDNHPYLWGGAKDPASTKHHPDCPNLPSAYHGVGISTVGARTMAEEGKDYKSIIKYYYPRVEIKKRY